MTGRKAVLLVGAVLVSLVGYGAYYVDGLRHRNYFARYLVDANESAVVFVVLDEEDHNVIVLYERSTGKARYLTATPDNLRHPRLEKDGTLTLVIKPSEAEGISAILSCALTPLNCRRVFETEMGISSTLALGDGRYLASMSPFQGNSPAKNKYARNDIFLITPGQEARPITSLSAYGLGPIQRVGNRVFFSAYGAEGWPRPVALEPHNDVFTGEWSGGQNAMTNIVTFQPFDDLTIAPGTSNPSISPDGSILVAQTGYERDGVIVIHDFKSGSNLLHELPPDCRANAIAVTENQLTWMEVDADRFRVVDFDIRTGKLNLSAEFAGSSFRKNPEHISIH